MFSIYIRYGVVDIVIHIRRLKNGLVINDIFSSKILKLMARYCVFVFIL